MQPCPSCGAPLDRDGICSACGALSRGYFRGLDLGAPQVAAAVAHGLDFYRLLDMPPTSELRPIARRYRQLRALFPDNPATLDSGPARRLALLETAGRVLTDPRLRQRYDELRASRASTIELDVVRCAGCAAPLADDQLACPYCGSPRPHAHAAPHTPPAAGEVPPATEPVDYYTMLGLTALHLGQISGARPAQQRASFSQERLSAILSSDTPIFLGQDPPRVEDVDRAALERQRQTLLSTGLDAEERTRRVAEYELARRILRDDRRRETYDALLLGFRQGRLDGGRLDALQQLQVAVQGEIAEEQGATIDAAQGAALLRQGLGYLQAELPGEALVALRRALVALPDSAEAHAGMVRAILASGDPLDLGPHLLRELLRSVEQLTRLGAPLSNGDALAALARGLLARDAGDATEAEAQLRDACQRDARLSAAWRGLAALALSRGASDAAINACRRALAVNASDERALLMMAGACLQARQRAQARDVATHLAGLRGGEWTADAVLEEIGG